MRSERNVFINIEQKLETEGVNFFSREFTATKYCNAQSVISVPSLHTENVFIFIMVRFHFAKILLLFSRYSSLQTMHRIWTIEKHFCFCSGQSVIDTGF